MGNGIKISKKLFLTFVFLSLITVVIAGMGIYSLIILKDSIAVTEKTMESLPVITEQLTNLSSMQSVARDAVINFHNMDIFDADKEKFEKYSQKYRSELSKLAEAGNSSAWKNKLSNAQTVYQDILEPQLQKVIEFADGNQLAQADDLLQQSYSAESAIYNTYSDFMNQRIQAAEQNSQHNQKAAFLLCVVLLALSATGISVSAILGFRISKSISNPLKQVALTIKSFASGSLNDRVSYISCDEIGMLSSDLNTAFDDLQNIVQEISGVLISVSQGNLTAESVENFAGDFQPVSEALNKILNNLNQTFDSFQSTAVSIDKEANQVSEGTQTIANGVLKQAEAVEQLYVSIEDASVSVRKNSEDIEHTAGSMSLVSQKIIGNNGQMRDMLSAINDISKSSKEIEKITDIINKIAFQTNILALNASVEAAKAGTYGKGFSVVADEVRRLAAQTAEFSSRISQWIQKSASKVNLGLTIASGTAQSLEETSQEIERISDGINLMKSEIQQQTVTFSKITQEIGEISNVVQENSETAEKEASVSKRLFAHSNLLIQQTGKILLRKSEA